MVPVHICPIMPADLPEMMAMRNDTLIWRWCRQHTLLNPIGHEKWYQSVCQDPKINMFAIRSADNVLVGICGLTDIDRVHSRAEFSLYVSPAAQGMHIGAKALKLLLNHAFMDQNLNVVWGETFEGNHAYNLFRRVGMKFEGTRRQFYFKGGKYIDAHLVSMTRADFDEIAPSW